MPKFVDMDAAISIETGMLAEKKSGGEKAQRTKQERDTYHQKVRDTLFKLAGVTGGQLREIELEFFSICLALGEIHTEKSIQYGDYIKTHGDEPELMALTQHFCDIKRKFVRAENSIRRRNEGVTIELEELIETYADLAVYSVMGLKLIFHILERDYAED